MSGGRTYSTGSIADAEGGVRAYLHIKRLRALAASIEVHCRHAPMLLAAAEAMEQLARRNQKMGRQLGNRMQRCVATARGYSFKVSDPETAEQVADLAADGPVTVYVWRDRRRVRVTRRADGLPKGARCVSRFDEGTDYRAIVQKLQSIQAPEKP